MEQNHIANIQQSIHEGGEQLDMSSDEEPCQQTSKSRSTRPYTRSRIYYWLGSCEIEKKVISAVNFIIP